MPSRNTFPKNWKRRQDDLYVTYFGPKEILEIVADADDVRLVADGYLQDGHQIKTRQEYDDFLNVLARAWAQHVHLKQGGDNESLELEDEDGGLLTPLSPAEEMTRAEGGPRGYVFSCALTGRTRLEAMNHLKGLVDASIEQEKQRET